MTKDQYQDNPVNVEVGLRAEAKVNLDIDVPEDVTRSMADRLMDALSPFTESLALVGDTLRLRRQETLLKIAIRAKEIAAIEGLNVDPVPEKFLSHFLERASLESPESPLIEKWSKLLVSASLSHDRNLSWCIRVLDELDPQEAAMLDELHSRTYTDAENYTRHQAETEFQRDMKILSTIHSTGLSDHFSKLGDMHYVFIEDDVAYFNSMDMSGFECGEQLLHLESVGLVWVLADKISLKDQMAFVLRAVLTPLGMYFVSAVTADD